MIEIEKCALCGAEAVLKNSNNGVGASYIKCENSRNGGNNCKNSIFVDGWGDDGDYIEKWNITNRMLKKILSINHERNKNEY